MKLLRLTTQSENDTVGQSTAIFNATLNDDLEIEENSMIALDNLSLENDMTALIISSQNNEITYQISTNFPKSVQLNLGSFNKDNYETLLNDIANKLNENAGYHIPNLGALFDTRELGIEWKSGLNFDNKVYIEYKLSQQGEYITNWEYTSTQVERKVIGARDVWAMKSGASGGNLNVYTNSMLFPSSVSKGNGYIRCRIQEFIPQPPYHPKAQGFMIGLSKKDLGVILPSQLTEDDIDYGLRLTTDGSTDLKYVTQEKSVYDFTPTLVPGYNGVGDITNDFMEVTIDNGNILWNIYQDATGLPPEQIKIAQYLDPSVKLYPFVCFFGDFTNAKLNNLRITPSPYDPVLFSNPYPSIDVASPPFNRKIRGENFLNFQSISVAQFLGFENTRIPIIGTELDYDMTYTANKIFDPVDLADAFLVEMLNLPLLSYDSYVHQRKNILAVIPKSNANGVIIYEATNLKFIDLNNKTKQLLRNIQVRVVKSDYTPVSLRGFGTMTLLIKSKAE